MSEVAETIYAPEFAGGDWIQGPATNLREERGKSIVLVDFWDYTCVNCIRTLPYVTQWHARYAREGLKVVGVHAPEFKFARDRSQVAEAVRQFGIEYPVVLDNDYAIWRAWSNRYWPAKYLVDSKGRIKYFHFGEGGYQETETALQRMLRELNPSAILPPPLEPIRDTDRAGAVCYRVTPELYFGYARGAFGNPEGVVRDQTHQYRDPGHHAEAIVYLSGSWAVGEEFARSESAAASVSVRFTAKDVNLVMAPATDGLSGAEVTLSAGMEPGADVKRRDGKNIVTVDRPRMYNLVANSGVGSGAVTLRAMAPGLCAYAFTFISCAVA